MPKGDNPSEESPGFITKNKLIPIWTDLDCFQASKNNNNNNHNHRWKTRQCIRGIRGIPGPLICDLTWKSPPWPPSYTNYPHRSQIINSTFPRPSREISPSSDAPSKLNILQLAVTAFDPLLLL